MKALSSSNAVFNKKKIRCKILSFEINHHRVQATGNMDQISLDLSRFCLREEEGVGPTKLRQFFLSSRFSYSKWHVKIGTTFFVFDFLQSLGLTCHPVAF